jgi:hypothetical protein
MSYLILLYGFLTFFTAICLHIIVWRCFPPKTHVKLLLIIFFAIPAAVQISCFVAINNFGTLGLTAINPVDIMAVYMFHITLAAAYILTYPALQAQCPTLSMLLIIGHSMPDGAKSDELKSTFEVAHLLEPRLRDLVGSGMVNKIDDSYTITGKGLFILSPLLMLRKLLGLPAGRG